MLISLLQETAPEEAVTETGDVAVQAKVDTVEGKPDSTTAVKSADGSGSPNKEVSYKPTRKTFEVLNQKKIMFASISKIFQLPCDLQFNLK